MHTDAAALAHVLSEQAWAVAARVTDRVGFPDDLAWTQPKREPKPTWGAIDNSVDPGQLALRVTHELEVTVVRMERVIPQGYERVHANQ